MKTILCYGDSITWGYIPGSAARFPLEKRWTSLLQHKIGDDYHVIAEGLCGRYTVLDEPYRAGRNGAMLLQPILETHSPVDLLILFLGTNDVLHHPGITAFDAARGAEVLARIALTSETGPAGKAPRVLLISPPRIRELSAQLSESCHGNPSCSDDFSRYFGQIADAHNLYFLDSAEHVEPSAVDGVHLDEHGHAVLGKAITGEVMRIFNGVRLD